MVWQRMIQRLSRRRRAKNQLQISGRKHSERKRGLRLESLAKRELLAGDLGAINGISFADETGNGLTADDTRLVGIQVDLFRDVDASGTLTAADGVAIDSTTTDASGMYMFRGLNDDTFIVVQANAGVGLQEPDPQIVTIPDDAGIVLTTIDDFSETDQTVQATSTVATDSSSATAPESLGGFRDLSVTRTSASGIINVAADSVTDLLSIGSQSSTEGSVLVQYDGNDGTITLDPTGLGGLSLAGDNPGDPVDQDAGILIQASSQNAGETVTIRIYTDATNFATATVNIPVEAGVNQEDVFVRYNATNFTFTGTPDFNNVGALEFEATIGDDNDATFAAFTVRGPSLETANLLNDRLLSLGGNVFSDSGGGANTNNGQLDTGEVGLDIVVVQLFATPTGGGAIDPANQVAAATTATDANGDYLFTGLAAGDYIVVIPDSEFVTGEPLFGYLTSTGNDPAPDPDDDVDGDDNGRVLAGVGLSSGTVTLAPGSEPTNDGETGNANDEDSNLTLDFGVIPTIDLAITKTLDAAASTLQAGGGAFFDIDFQNNGPLSATNVVITDAIPAGLTIDQANSNFNGFVPTITGQNISIAIGTLASGATGSIRIATDIDAGQTADLTNTAVIAGDEVETNAANNQDDAAVDLVNTDLVVTKSDNTTGSVVAGEQFTYTITVTNNGPDLAQAVVATDNLPANLSFVSGTFTTGTGTVTEDPADSGQLTIAVGDLASGASEVIDIVVLVAADAGDTVDNTVTVIGTPDTDSIPNNNSDTETTPIVRNVDVGVTKTTTDAAIAGGSLTYSIAVTNSGPGVARGVTVTDTLNAGLTFDSFDAGTSGVTIGQAGQDLTFTVGELASGVTETFTFVVDIASSATGTINNEAVITTTDIDTVAANNNDDVDITVGTDVDLVLDKAVDMTTAVPGQDTLTYTFTITHDTDSVSDSGQVTFTDTLPAGVTGVTIVAAGSTSFGFDTDLRVVTVVYAPIAIGEDRTFTVTASVNEDATGTVENTGSITVAGGESDTTNNSDTVITTLTPEFDVAVVKTVDDTTPTPGQTIEYSIALNNSGPSTATGVVLSDDVPAGLTFVSGTLEGQSATLTGSTVSFPEFTLDDNQTVTATLQFIVGIDTTGTVTNTASIVTDTGETNANNNSDTADITATPQADLTVTKTVDDAVTRVGEQLTYTVTVTNSGVSTAVAATATDTLPTDVTFTNGTGPNGGLSATNGVITVNGGDLAPGGSFSFTVNGTVAAAATGNLVNNVTVVTTTPESNANNNSASATSAVDPFIRAISGSVYVDANDNGVEDAGEAPIPNVMITLTGTNSLGETINRTATTNANGDYFFTELGRGTYQIVQEQPIVFDDGQETAGTGGGTPTATNNQFANITLDDTDAINFNFGELERVEPLSKRRFLASSPRI